jgi:fructosamine-3-kinase
VSADPATSSPLPSPLPAVVRTTPLPGGDIAQVVRAELADGRTVVVKSTTYDAALEAEGLVALDEAGAPVPAVLAVEPRRLVLEHVAGPPGLGRARCRSLARTHGRTAERFGWHRDNVIGPLRQRNGRA